MNHINILFIIAGAIVLLAVLGAKFKWHPFLALLAVTLLTGFFAKIPLPEIANTASEGFGNMMKKIGLVVILGTLIGSILEKSGAIMQIADSILKLFGKGKTVAAVTIIGAVVGIPIFCDSGFVILSGLLKPLAKKSGKNYIALVTALASGLYVTHCLLPPHPGSIAGAANLGLKDHLGAVMGINFIVAVPTTIVAWWYSNFRASKVAFDASSLPEAIENTNQNPPLWKCVLPITVPVFLIAGASFVFLLPANSSLKPFIEFAGHPTIALMIGLVLSLLTINKNDKSKVQAWISESVMHAGGILAIVGAGGMFGEVLKKTSLSSVIEGFTQSANNSALLFLFIAWATGVLLKTAQGSTTSAIIVVSALIAPFAGSAGFNTSLELSLLLSAIAGGAMMVSHANDAYFWVIAQFASVSMEQNYKSFSLATITMSITVLLTVLALAFFLI